MKLLKIFTISLNLNAHQICQKTQKLNSNIKNSISIWILQSSCSQQSLSPSGPETLTTLQSALAKLLGSNAFEIALLNNISSTREKIPNNQLVMVPIFCTCSKGIFQHLAFYTLKENNTYIKMASNIYQTLMTCYALIRNIGYVPNDIPKDTNITGKRPPNLCFHGRGNSTLLVMFQELWHTCILRFQRLSFT